MATSNIRVSGAWEKVADDTDDPVLIQCTGGIPWEVAAVASDEDPTIDLGHRLIGAQEVITRDLIGAGFIFVRTSPSEAARSALFVVSK